MSTLVAVLKAVFWGCLLLSALVFIHEGGHYLSARAFGMRVTEFFLGMPCRWRLSHKSKGHGTEVGVTPILLGGYNRICGMEGEPGENAASVLAYVAANGRVEVEAMAADLGIDKFDAYGELKVLYDWAALEPYYDADSGEHPDQDTWPSHAQTVRRDVNLLTAFDSGHDFTLPGSTKAGQPHAIAGTPEEFLKAEAARTYLGKSFVARVVTLVAGPAVNVICGFALLVACFSVGGIQTYVDLPVIGSVTQDSLAEVAGMQAGDTITSVDGVEVTTWEDMGDALQGSIAAGEPFEVEFTRDGQSLQVEVDPADDPDGSGLFGVNASVATYHPSLSQSATLSWRYLTYTVSYIAKLFVPATTAEVVSQSTSVVGISVMASQAASTGAEDFFFLMAGISLSLGLMNLIPIPPLDGGKLLIELIQLVSRRRVPLKVQNGLSYVGIALALLLFVVVLRQDIVRFVFGG